MFFIKKKKIKPFGRIVFQEIRKISVLLREVKAGIDRLYERQPLGGPNTGKQMQELIALEMDNADTIAELASLSAKNVKSLEERINSLEKQHEAAQSALIKAADLAEDFYVYAKKSGDADIAGQASLMWAGTCKALNAVGLARIADEHAVYDPSLNTIQETASDKRFANGAVTEVLQSGYTYGGKIIRKSLVIVNKIS